MNNGEDNDNERLYGLIEDEDECRLELHAAVRRRPRLAAANVGSFEWTLIQFCLQVTSPI
jgi:hypothetical protein